jgi:DNA-binding transcriptional ArsR family regulator
MLKSSDELLDGAFKALGDRARRAILVRLSRGEATLGELARPLTMTVPAVHQHLGVLEAAGLVSSERRGRERWCRLEGKGLQRAEEWLTERRSLWQGRLDALGEFLAEQDQKPRKGRVRR